MSRVMPHCWKSCANTSTSSRPKAVAHHKASAGLVRSWSMAFPNSVVRCAFGTSRKKHVVTTEGLPEDFRKDIADCFTYSGAAQCGFCTPGIVMRTFALLKKTPNPSPEDIRQALKPHLCRCTGYKKIIEAILLLAKIQHGDSLPKAHAWRAGRQQRQSLSNECAGAGRTSLRG